MLFNLDGIVRLSILRNYFTTAFMDNIDHHPSSARGYIPYHGINTSIFQHRTDIKVEVWEK